LGDNKDLQALHTSALYRFIKNIEIYHDGNPRCYVDEDGRRKSIQDEGQAAIDAIITSK
jgi:hypothetical protein